MLSFQPTNQVFSDALYVFPTEETGILSILQSRIHAMWVWGLSSTMKKDLRYSATDCFENFPFPRADKHQQDRLDALGERLQDERRTWTMGNDQGLTALYNALKDPRTTDKAILTLRELHMEVDRAVLDAYGWSDLSVPPYQEYAEDDDSPQAKETREAQQFYQDEIMDRLYALNAERAAEEGKTGVKPKRKGKKKGKKRTDDDGGQGVLL